MIRRRVLALIAAAAAVLGGCGEPVDPASVDLDLTAYPACAEQPRAPDLPAVPGLVLPQSATPFTQTEIGPLTQVEGTVALTPLQAKAFYESHPDLDVILIEDERIEAEILVTDGNHRMFVKVQITCDGGSNFTATVGAEAVADALPAPAGQPGS